MTLSQENTLTNEKYNQRNFQKRQGKIRTYFPEKRKKSNVNKKNYMAQPHLKYGQDIAETTSNKHIEVSFTLSFISVGLHFLLKNVLLIKNNF